MQEKTISSVAREMGKRGGVANIEKYGKNRMKEIGRLGGLKARENREKARQQKAK